MLVCTTIVENGLDVARAGTIVIEGAESFGLASLHQLRGRVGRSGRRGFCLLEVPRNAQLSEGAQKRLTAMEDADGLGAGFAIAEADLAVRGAGDLLGEEQSGHVAAVGHALYSRLIERAAREQAGDLRPAPERTGHSLPGTGNLPADWIPPALARLNAYRWLTHADDEDQLGVAVEHLGRTWGSLPEEAQRFVAGVRLRIAMADAGVLHAAKREGGRHAHARASDRPRRPRGPPRDDRRASEHRARQAPLPRRRRRRRTAVRPAAGRGRRRVRRAPDGPAADRTVVGQGYRPDMPPKAAASTPDGLESSTTSMLDPLRGSTSGRWP